MYRTLKIIALASALSTSAALAQAQDYVFSWNPRTGDAWIDNTLTDVNRYGTRYREPFVDEMTRYYGAPRDLVTELLVTRRWAPGDVYYACALAQVTGQPCRAVVSEWDRDHGQGWGAIAKRMGIKPGSAQFHRLKKGFVPTYDRWARPIRLDDALRVDFPHHGKGKLHGKSSKDSGKSSHAGKAHGGDKGGKATSSRKAGGSDKSKGNSGKSSAGKGKGGNGKGKG